MESNKDFPQKHTIVRERNVRELSEAERPREKAIQNGFKSLTDLELLAIIFGTGTRGKDVMNLSREILDDFQGHLSQVARLSVKELIHRYSGIGQAKAISLLASLEMGHRAALDAEKERTKQITSSSAGYNRMKHHFANLSHEEFWILHLNHSNRVIREVCISRGGLASTVVDVKIIMKEAIMNLSSALMLFHNHPSGAMTPSGPDDGITRKIVEAAKYFDIKVLDHLIVTDAGFYSYHDEGKL